MKKILIIVLMALPYMANSQSQPPNQTFSGLLYEFKYALRADTIFLLPRTDTVGIRASLLAPGAMIYKISDKTFYGYDGSYWKSFASGILRAIDSLRYDASTGTFYTRLTTGGEIAVPTGLVDSLANMTLQRVTERGDTTNRPLTLKNRSTSALTIQQYSSDSRIRWIDSLGVLHGAVGDLGTSNNFEMSAYAGPMAITSATSAPIQFRINGTQTVNMDDTLTTFNTVAAGQTPVLSNHLTTKNYVDTAISIRIWQYPMSTLVSQPAIQIQPTHTIPQVAGELQAQINAFTGKYIEVAPVAYQNNTAAKVNGTINIASTTTSAYLVMLERNNNTSYDAVVGYKVGTDTAWTGMGNRNNNDYSINMPKSKTRFINADSSGTQFISLPTLATSKIYTITRGGKWLFGDNLSATASATYPIHVTNTPDTSAYFLNKVIMDVNLSTADSGRILAPTDWVKKQAYLKQSNANFQTVLSTGNTATSNMGINATVNSAWAATFVNSGTTTANGVYVNIGASSTGTIFRADKNGTSKLQVTNAGATQVGGSMYLPIASVSANTTLDDTHYTVRATASGITITLPSAGASFSGGTGKVYVIMNYNTGGSITISSFQNNGSAVTTITNNTKVMLQSDGTNWYQIN